jgi:hypothetical protein
VSRAARGGCRQLLEHRGVAEPAPVGRLDGGAPVTDGAHDPIGRGLVGEDVGAAQAEELEGVRVGCADRGEAVAFASRLLVEGDHVVPAEGASARGVGDGVHHLGAVELFWGAASNPEASMHALMREILLEEIPPASERVAALGAGPLPPGFDAWFSRCVTRSIDERFPAASALYAAFEEVLAGRAPALARPVTLAPARRPRLALMLAASALALAIGLGVASGGDGTRALARQTIDVDGRLVRDKSPPPSAAPLPSLPPPLDEPSPSAAPTTTPAPALPAAGAARLPPFDHHGAQLKLAEARLLARHACSGMSGPPSVTMRIVWNAQNGIAHITTADVDAISPRHSCAQGHFQGVTVRPFSGDSPTVLETVTFSQ